MYPKLTSKFIRYGLCGSLLFLAATALQAQINVTFKVNMAVAYTNGQFIPVSSGGTDYVEARGSFQSPTWTAGFVLTNDPAASNPFLFSGTYLDANSPGTAEEYKFVVDNGSGPLNWESPASTGGNNRQFTLGTSGTVVGTNETLATVFFNDASVPNITNNVTFQVNMAVQVGNGNFVPPGDFVEARGSFNNWNGGFTLTNNPSAPNPNLYTGTAPVVAPPGGPVFYKYIVDGGNGVLGWENPTSTGGGNRQFTLANAATQTTPNVYFNDAGPGSSLSQNTVVTFSVNMTNAVGTDSYVFNPSIDSVFINGVTTADSSGFWTWAPDTSLGSLGGPSEFMLTNNPVGSKVYSLQLTIPAGTPFGITYKYGINGADDEAGFAVNHVRYVRTNGSYVMPMDTFGNQLVEQPFGNLKIAKPSGGAALVTWTGLPNVHLQTSSSLIAGWTDHPETAGLSSTNWPVGPGSLFFRLIQPN